MLAAIVQSSRSGSRQKVGVWKSSSLPLLKALSAEARQGGASGMTALSLMEEWAEDVPVRLARDVDEDGWKLVRRLSDKEKVGPQGT